MIVKPVDSAGSKGVTRVDEPRELPRAIDHALDCSPSKHFIIEDFLEKEGYSSDSDSFSIDGDLVFCTLNIHLRHIVGHPQCPDGHKLSCEVNCKDC